MLWQVQEAKQRFSELLRAVQSDGPQIVTRHGEEIAVVIDIADFHRLRGDVADVKDVLLGGPKFDDDVAEVFATIEAERKAAQSILRSARDLPA
jgi:antitoxin Phd